MSKPRGKIPAGLLIDDEDRHVLGAFSWNVGGTGYVRRTDHANGGEIKLHRAIMNAAPHEVIDHINGNRLDNRRKNLRSVSVAENSQNRGKVNAKSGHLGVHWNAARNKWQVSFKRAGRTYYFGVFAHLEDAVRVSLAERERLSPGIIRADGAA